MQLRRAERDACAFHYCPHFYAMEGADQQLRAARDAMQGSAKNPLPFFFQIFERPWPIFWVRDAGQGSAKYLLSYLFDLINAGVYDLMRGWQSILL
jgi:hypothetical protein